MIRFLEALDVVRSCIPHWKRASEPPTDRLDYLRACICVLVDHQGAKWLRDRPGLLQDVDPVLHCASFRTADLREYNAVLSVNFMEQTLYFRPSDVEDLIKF